MKIPHNVCGTVCLRKRERERERERERKRQGEWRNARERETERICECVCVCMCVCIGLADECTQCVCVPERRGRSFGGPGKHPCVLKWSSNSSFSWNTLKSQSAVPFCQYMYIHMYVWVTMCARVCMFVRVLKWSSGWSIFWNSWKSQSAMQWLWLVGSIKL